MHEEREGSHRESQALADLWATPVGRRWLLKAGLGSAAAAVMAGRASAAPRVRAGKPDKLTSPSAGAEPPPTGRLQFALGAAVGVGGLEAVVRGERLPLVPHTNASRAALAAEGGLWGKMNLSALTHHVANAPLPTHRGTVVSVYGRRKHGRRGRRRVLVSQVWHCPAEATLALALTADRVTGSLHSVVDSREQLASLGLTAAEVKTPQELVQLSTVVDTYSAAESLVKFHPNVSTVDKMSLAATNSLLSKTAAVQSLGTYIAKMQRAGRDYATLVQATDPDGSPSQLQVGDQTTTFSTVMLNRDDQTFVDAHVSALKSGVTAVRDDGSLGSVIDKPLEQDPAAATKTWAQPQGVVAQPTPYSPSLATGAGVDIKIKNDGFWFGTRTKLTGGYQDGKVPLTLYNNFVRWVWVYVQYLGKDNTNLSANQNAKWPDTQYAQSVGLLPQVFTVLGIPIWDTNSIDVTLNFPKGAHTARLLYCGLGSDLLSGGWRQYFPADAYPGGIAPSNEVMVPSIITGLLTIGLTAFALVTDFDIATTWAVIRKGLIEGVADKSIVTEFLKLATRAVNLTKAELAATTVMSGFATYEDVKANGGPSNLWNILLGLASVIPKFIFAPRQGAPLLGKVAGAILANETASKVIESLPLIGQVLAAVEAVGDAVTLAEVCTETILSPWVIENEVTLTYKSTVTISHDPCAATFPTTARSWRLEPKVDGAVVLDPLTGNINQGGKVRSDPLVVDVVAPFGGSKIQYSVVFMDDGGRQVATGVSAEFANDDPSNVADKVAFAIKQLPATITATTVFKRTATTSYSTADKGYTWSDQVTVKGTTNAGIDEVTGAAVATTLGVAGMVWKQKDRFYLRGVPVAQNGATIQLLPARKEGYARRPFLLLDSFVDVTMCDANAPGGGNHVLLEPDETTDAYDIRKLTLDVHNGKLDWDPGASLGRFLLPVSAAALHSSGRVVAIHTDSGRVGAVEPLLSPLAVGGTGAGTTRLASYTAGPGTQVGLLSSPIAVAVTNPGTVLILEAAGPQLAAFDLNGNPAKYFGTEPDRKFTLSLDASRTYLDLAVDGASQIYLLYHTGDGADPASYHLDVYNADGTPLDTGSPGVNVPHIAVDYWRSIYAPNYQPLTDLGTTTPHISDLGVAEPSMSRFDPTQPA
jgi:hypothetical protein